MSSSKHFHLIVPVWGKTYTELFTDVCLPMLLTPGNIGVLDQANGDQFVIVTTWVDHLAIKRSLSYRRLQKKVSVEFVLIDGIVNINNSHAAMSHCYGISMRRSSVIPGETHFIFLTPDSFWPDGTFRELVSLSLHGVRVAMAGGLRLNSESMTTILKERIQQSPENPSIQIHELARLALDNLHQMSDALNLLSSRKEFLNVWPSHMYWINERDHQLIAHCFHLHPLMVLSSKVPVKIGTTIDGEYLNNLPYTIDQYRVIGGEYMAFEFTPAERDWGQPLEIPSIAAMVKFTLLHTNRKHWHFFGQRIFLDGSPGTPVPLLLDQLIGWTVEAIQRQRMVARLIQIFGLQRVVACLLRSRRVDRLFRRLLAWRINSRTYT